METESPTACSISVPCRQISTEVLWRADFLFPKEKKKREKIRLWLYFGLFSLDFQEMLGCDKLWG